MSAEDQKTLSHREGPWAYILAEELRGYKLTDNNRILDTDRPKRQPLYLKDRGKRLELRGEAEFEISIADYQAKFIQSAVAREAAGTDSTLTYGHPVGEFPYWAGDDLIIYEIDADYFWDDEEGISDHQEAVEAAKSIANIVRDINLLREKQEEALAEWIEEI